MWGFPIAFVKFVSSWPDAVGISPDGSRAIAAFSGALKILDVSSGNTFHRVYGILNDASAVALTPDASRALTAVSNMVKVWDLEASPARNSAYEHKGRVTVIAFTPDGQYAVSGSSDKTVKIWDAESGETMRTLTGGHHLGVSAVASTPDGCGILSASYDGTLLLWDLESRAAIARFLHSSSGFGKEPFAVSLSPDGQRLVSASCNGIVKVFNLSDLVEIQDFKIGFERQTFVSHPWWLRKAVGMFQDGRMSAALTPDCRLAITGDWGIKVWDLDTARKLQTLNRFGHWTVAVAISQNGRWAAAVDWWRESLKVWDLETGRKHVLRAIYFDEGQSSRSHLKTIAFSPDGRRVVAGSREGRLFFWELDGSGDQDFLIAHNGEINAIAFTPDSRYVVTASKDQTVKVWKLEWAHLVATFTTDAEITCCAVGPDSLTIAAGDYSGHVHILRLEADEPADRKSGPRVNGEAKGLYRNLFEAAENQTITSGIPELIGNLDESHFQKGQQGDGETRALTIPVLIKRLNEEHFQNIVRITRETPYSSDAYAAACRLVTEYTDEQVLGIAGATAISILKTKPGFTAALLERMLGVIQQAVDRNAEDTELFQKAERLNAFTGE